MRHGAALVAMLWCTLAAAEPAEAPVAPVKASADAVAWFAGTWRTRGEGPETEETWTTARGGTLFGVNRVISDGATVFHEQLRVEPVGEGIAYVARPKGAPAETAFTLVELEGQKAVFANPAHDFPQRITYRRSDTVLLVDVWGPERSFVLELHRVP